MNDEFLIEIPRANSKILKSLDLYILNIGTKRIINSNAGRQREGIEFNYSGYLSELAHREQYTDSVSSISPISPISPICSVDNWINVHKNFFKHLFEKYTARTVYYCPCESNNNTESILGFVFDDNMKRALFSLKYDSLRAKHIKIILWN